MYMITYLFHPSIFNTFNLSDSPESPVNIETNP